MTSASSSSLLRFVFSLLLFSTLGNGHSPSCGCASPASGSGHHHRDGNGADHIHHRHHDHGDIRLRKLPEELAEEVDLGLDGFDDDHHHHRHLYNHEHDSELSPIGLWVKAMGCSLIVSLASLICLMILPLICFKGKPSKAVVDSLALFGAGAMLGDAFLHQLPHAFDGVHSHSHGHHVHSSDDIHHGHGHSHSHSLEDLSAGLSVLTGIVLFLLVEKIVRYVEENANGGPHSLGHGHHHSHRRQNKLKDDDDEIHNVPNLRLSDSKSECTLATATDSVCQNGDNGHERVLRERATAGGSSIDNKKALDSLNGHVNGAVIKKASSSEIPHSHSSSSLIFGYLNLFSDGVHNFTDGMALGSAFLLHGSVGGWSRTLFLLSHEIPQEIGDFGILVRSGFTVSKALFFNFLSALVALAGTALALVLGKDPGQSSLVEGFTAGGFIYIAVAGVLPEMNKEKTTVRSTAVQFTCLVSGIAIALCISLVE